MPMRKGSSDVSSKPGLPSPDPAFDPTRRAGRAVTAPPASLQRVPGALRPQGIVLNSHQHESLHFTQVDIIQEAVERKRHAARLLEDQLRKLPAHERILRRKTYLPVPKMSARAIHSAHGKMSWVNKMNDPLGSKPARDAEDLAQRPHLRALWKDMLQGMRLVK